MSEYLWDKTGEPDAEVERLETLLANLSHIPRPLALPSEEAAHVSPRARRRDAWRHGAWLRFFPARLFEPVGLAAAAALVLTLLLGASVLMRARVAMDEGHAGSRAERAASREVRPTQMQPQPPRQAAPRQQETPSTPQATATVGHGPESADVLSKANGGAPSVRQPPRVRASAQTVASVKPRQKTAAPVGQTVARAGGAGRLETLSEKGREGVSSLFDGTRLMAKEQLIYALRLTGAKLKEVQSKAHGADEQKTGSGAGLR
jgi:hypothetical protein